MIELVVHIDSKITTCCYIMQPIRNRFVPSMLAAGANKKIALVRIFVKMNCSIPTIYLLDQLFIFLLCV